MMGVYVCSSTKALLTKVVARCSCGTPDRFLVIGTGNVESYPDSATACFGGHGESAYEQKTQQSPGLELSFAPHPRHSWMRTHAFTGISSIVAQPQMGQVMLARVKTPVTAVP